MLKHYLNALSYQIILSTFSIHYLKEKGQQKVNDVLNQISYGKTINGYFATLRANKKSPGDYDGFLSKIKEQSYFVISKWETICFGSLVALEKWRMLTLRDKTQPTDYYLKKVAINTILQAHEKQMFRTISGNTPFFDRYSTNLKIIVENAYEALLEEFKSAQVPISSLENGLLRSLFIPTVFTSNLSTYKQSLNPVLFELVSKALELNTLEDYIINQSDFKIIPGLLAIRD